MPERTNNDNNIRVDNSSSSSYSLVEISPTITLRILEDLSSDEEEDEDVEDSVGRFIWPTSIPLLRQILASFQQPTLSSLKTAKKSVTIVVELGAGCGVLGMGLAAVQAQQLQAAQRQQPKDKEDGRDSPGRTPEESCTLMHVLLTDHDDEWLQRNLALNKTLLIQQQAKTAAINVEVARLDWKNTQDIVAIKNRILEFLLLQIQLAKSNLNDSLENSDGVPSGSVHLMIIGSDILYNHESHKALAFTLWQLSQVATAFCQYGPPMMQQQQPTITTQIILGFPDRDNCEEAFLPCAREYFGDDFPSSQPIVFNDQRKNEVNKASTARREKKMDPPRIIDFTVNEQNDHE